MRWARITCMLLILSIGAVQVDPPMRVHTRTLEGRELVESIVSFDREGFELVDVKGEKRKVSWSELDANRVMAMHERLLAQASAREWLIAGKMMMELPNGTAAANRAFARAIRIDPEARAIVEKIRRGEEVELDEAPAETEPRETTQTPEAAAREQARLMGPQFVGRVDPSAWGYLNPEQMERAVTELKAFAERTQHAVNVRLTLHETNYFLFFSDLPLNESRKWASVLDEMYLRLGELFEIDQNRNIFLGKAMVMVFSRQEDYQAFQLRMHKTDATGTAGMCHGFGDGRVHISFYRQPSDGDFAHVLVHESVHGFLHRYRSPTDLPTWLHEGLAEAIATELVKREGMAQSSMAEARTALHMHRTLGNLFIADDLEAWQYPIARTLVEFMIRSNGQAFAAFVKGIKDGMSVPESLKEHFDATYDDLAVAYGQAMGVRGLRAR